MKTEIETFEQLCAMPIGSEVYKVESNDVRRYKIACSYPSHALKAILITYGTNEGCSKWISETHIKTGKMFLSYDSAVDKLIEDMQSDLEAVKRIYKDDRLKRPQPNEVR